MKETKARKEFNRHSRYLSWQAYEQILNDNGQNKPPFHYNEFMDYIEFCLYYGFTYKYFGSGNDYLAIYRLLKQELKK